MYLYFFAGPDKPSYESYCHLREASIQADPMDSVIEISHQKKDSLTLIIEDQETFSEWLELLSLQTGFE